MRGINGRMELRQDERKTHLGIENFHDRPKPLKSRKGLR